MNGNEIVIEAEQVYQTTSGQIVQPMRPIEEGVWEGHVWINQESRWANARDVIRSENIASEADDPQHATP